MGVHQSCNRFIGIYSLDQDFSLRNASMNGIKGNGVRTTNKASGLFLFYIYNETRDEYML